MTEQLSPGAAGVVFVVQSSRRTFQVTCNVAGRFFLQFPLLVLATLLFHLLLTWLASDDPSLNSEAKDLGSRASS